MNINISCYLNHVAADVVPAERFIVVYAFRLAAVMEHEPGPELFEAAGLFQRSRAGLFADAGHGDMQPAVFGVRVLFGALRDKRGVHSVVLIYAAVMRHAFNIRCEQAAGDGCALGAGVVLVEIMFAYKFATVGIAIY